jgi:hypothetical protein
MVSSALRLLSGRAVTRRADDPGLRLSFPANERPPALPDNHQPFIRQHADSPAGSVPGYPVFLHEVADARHPAAWRELARADALPQERGHLKIGRLLRIMIDSH